MHVQGPIVNDSFALNWLFLWVNQGSIYLSFYLSLYLYLPMDSICSKCAWPRALLKTLRRGAMRQSFLCVEWKSIDVRCRHLWTRVVALARGWLAGVRSPRIKSFSPPNENIGSKGYDDDVMMMRRMRMMLMMMTHILRRHRSCHSMSNISVMSHFTALIWSSCFCFDLKVTNTIGR